MDGLLELDAFKTDHNHERDYVESWAEQLRVAIEKLQPSLRPEITLETFERENAPVRNQHYWPRVTVYVHNLPHSLFTRCWSVKFC